MGSPTKDESQVAHDYASKSDVEDQAIGTTYEIKRDLGRRHINMIAIAGMIVRTASTLIPYLTDLLNCRVLDCS